MEISLKEAVVILDEGHNIEDASREAASFVATKADAQHAIDELNGTIQYSAQHQVVEHRCVRDMVRACARSVLAGHAVYMYIVIAYKMFYKSSKHYTSA